MSARAENWVLQLCEQHEDLRPIHCHVLQLLAIRHDHDYGIAWPSVDRMAAESHYTDRAIFKALDELTSLGLLHRSYGELPRKSARDRVKLGNRYAFPGLDEIVEDDGPRLLGGRPRDAVDERGSSEPEAVEMNLTHALDERDVTAQSHLDEPDAPVTTYRTSTRSVDYVRNTQERARAPDEASPRRADEKDGEPEPIPLRSEAQACPICGKPFVGAYADHHCPINRPPPRKIPPKLGGRLSMDEIREAERELERFARERAEQQQQVST